MPVAGDPAPEPYFTVDGGRCSEVYVAIPFPPAFLAREEGGTHEFSRVQFGSKGFRLSGTNNQLGPSRIVAAEFEHGRQLKLLCHDGYRVTVPAARCQLTYKHCEP